MPSKLALPVIDIAPYLPSNSSPPDLEGELPPFLPLPFVPSFAAQTAARGDAELSKERNE